MKGRAYRRHQDSRVKNKAKKVWFRYVGDEASSWDQLEIKSHNDLKCCSCTLCGNPRKWFNQVTRQEKLSELDFKEVA